MRQRPDFRPAFRQRRTAAEAVALLFLGSVSPSLTSSSILLGVPTAREGDDRREMCVRRRVMVCGPHHEGVIMNRENAVINQVEVSTVQALPGRKAGQFWRSYWRIDTTAHRNTTRDVSPPSHQAGLCERAACDVQAAYGPRGFGVFLYQATRGNFVKRSPTRRDLSYVGVVPNIQIPRGWLSLEEASARGSLRDDSNHSPGGSYACFTLNSLNWSAPALYLPPQMPLTRPNVCIVSDGEGGTLQL